MKKVFSPQKKYYAIIFKDGFKIYTNTSNPFIVLEELYNSESKSNLIHFAQIEMKNLEEKNHD